MQHEINQDIIDEAHQIVDNANKNADEEISRLNKQREDYYTNVLSDALWEEIDDNQKKAKIVDKLMSTIPFGNINTHTLENLGARIDDFIKDAARVSQAEDIILDLIEGIEKWHEQGNNLPEEIKMPYLDATRYIHGEKEYHIELEKHNNVEKFEIRSPDLELIVNKDLILLQEKIENHHIHYNINVKDHLIRKALILQGWTPPGGLTEEDLK